MILKVTRFIWNTNAALSRLFGKQRPGAVKKWREIREFRDVGPSAPPRQCQNFVPEN
jgi:hypothetical protein